MAIDPNGDLAVATASGELMLYSPMRTVDAGFNRGSPVNTGFGGYQEVAVQPDGKVLVTGDLWVSDKLRILYGRDRREAVQRQRHAGYDLQQRRLGDRQRLRPECARMDVPRRCC